MSPASADHVSVMSLTPADLLTSTIRGAAAAVADAVTVRPSVTIPVTASRTAPGAFMTSFTFHRNFAASFGFQVRYEQRVGLGHLQGEGPKWRYLRRSRLAGPPGDRPHSFRAIRGGRNHEFGRSGSRTAERCPDPGGRSDRASVQAQVHAQNDAPPHPARDQLQRLPRHHAAVLPVAGVAVDRPIRTQPSGAFER